MKPIKYYYHSTRQIGKILTIATTNYLILLNAVCSLPAIEQVRRVKHPLYSRSGSDIKLDSSF